jgi:hypothetical protein
VNVLTIPINQSIMDQTMAVVASKSESGVPSESVNALVPSSIDEPNLLLLVSGDYTFYVNLRLC